MKTNIEINPDFQKALGIMEGSNSNLFLTGKAGTGKSTLLEHFRNHTRKKVAVLAPTGVAALNVLGETIHSFFGFKPDITLEKIRKLSAKKAQIFKTLDTLIIDEISMVRADLLDYMDRFLRLNGKFSKKPFGGLQMIFIGDLYQLPPVVTGKEKAIFESHYTSPYFFSAKVMDQFPMEFIELEKVYRQKDGQLIEILNAIRNNSITPDDLAVLNQRVGCKLSQKNNNFIIHLTTLNQKANEINQEHLRALGGKIKHYQALIGGQFNKSSYPTDQELTVSEGAQVMLLNNDPPGRWVNGTIGKVVQIRFDDEKKSDAVTVLLPDGKQQKIFPHTWEIFHFKYDVEARRIESEVIGTFTQYPIRLAWALTIHKSQGKTFDKVVIDLGRGSFSHGQTYVGLSRCTSFEGISLTRPVRKGDILMDWKVVRFLTHFQYQKSEQQTPLEDKIALIQKAIAGKKSLQIVYLKNSDVKTRRTIKPLSVGEQQYMNKSFIGVQAFCLKRQEDRMFRVDRILEMLEV